VSEFNILYRGKIIPKISDLGAHEIDPVYNREQHISGSEIVARIAGWQLIILLIRKVIFPDGRYQALRDNVIEAPMILTPLYRQLNSAVGAP
jgi:hypothetical protein